MVSTKNTSVLDASWESQEMTRAVLDMVAQHHWRIYPQAVHDDEYGRVTLVHCAPDHHIVEAVAVYPESITKDAPFCPGVQIVREELDLGDLRKGTGERRVIAGPVWLGDDGLFSSRPSTEALMQRLRLLHGDLKAHDLGTGEVHVIVGETCVKLFLQNSGRYAWQVEGFEARRQLEDEDCVLELIENLRRYL